tara:strand:+ start:76 stop:306 length:231 start_codon:yes stop_codon:yes gene_type:complete
MAKYNLDYWRRRLSANTQALPQGEVKLMMSTVLETMAEQAKELEALRVQMESARSERSPRASKKLDPKGDSPSDSK